MLCHLCEPFLTDILNNDFVNWRHVETGWYTYRHGDHATVKAAAQAGCETCALLSEVREKRIPGYDQTSEKWLVHQSSIDYKFEYDLQQSRAQNTDQQLEYRAKRTFYLFTVLPRMSCLAFEIFDPKFPSVASDEETNDQALPYAVPTNAPDKSTISLASFWLNECVQNHPQCSRQVRAPLPTRVLDIQASGECINLRLQINKGQQGQYATLSHCWGGGSRLTLTKRTLSSFQRSIHFDELPPTFQDAVRLTALLGQRYLWIDALCILQDDQEDWRREAASMGFVFKNALFSISALSAVDSYSGLLNPRDTAQTVVDVAGRGVGIRERLPFIDEALKQSKLETRAWCLQERLLSLRILYVAPSQLYWECRTCVISETSPDDPVKIDLRELSRIFTGSGKYKTSSLNGHDYQAHWLHLVVGYSARNLTQRSDRLPAIAGLAEKARRELSLGTYIHGLWLENILAGLLWRRKSERRHETAEKLDRDAAVPSWSWASSSGAIEYPLLATSAEHRPTTSDLAIQSRHASVARDAASSVTLSVVGCIKRGSCKVATRPSSPSEAVFRPSGSLLVDHGLPCFLDAVDEPVSKGCYCLFVGTFVKQQQPKQKRRQEQQSFYLFLERAENTGTSQATTDESFGRFRRIGMGFDGAQKVESIFKHSEPRELDLI